VFDLLAPVDRKLKLFCAGRLDRDSEGLLILTNDGELAHRLTHPGSGVVKRYRVTLNSVFQPKHIAALCRGVTIEGDFLRAEKVILPKRQVAGDRRLEIHLNHGKKREIRRMLAAQGYRVARLQRIQIGGLVLRGLGPGRYRRLKSEELSLLFA
jgi:23S rRNA pseudouridine2605 synthase